MDNDEFMWKLAETWDNLESQYHNERLNLGAKDYEYETFRDFLNSLSPGDALHLFAHGWL